MKLEPAQRAERLESLAGMSERSGTEEGVGEVSLCDLPGFMSQHDAAHRSEIESWKRAVLG